MSGKKLLLLLAVLGVLLPAAAPAQAFLLLGGVDVIRGDNLILGGALEATVLLGGGLGLSLSGDAITATIPQETEEVGIGAIGTFAVRYYGRLTPAMGSYFAAYLLGLGFGYGIVGYEAYSYYPLNMYYAALTTVFPFYAEAGMHVVFRNRLVVQALLKGGASLAFVSDELSPFFSLGVSAGVFLD
ncbi:MAG: hypothetical protein JW820_17115 [Spirochaetales bacterium]|nr:hypothetical protein [Spirochaetales bacterium]